MKAAGVDPWLQIEFYLAPEDWPHLVEYLAAPFDPAVDTPQSLPWAHKRVRQGHRLPWTDDFRQIHLELSNESWNSIFAPWTFPTLTDAATGQHYSQGTVYGLFQEQVIASLKSSPWWGRQGLDRKFDFVLGGWTVNVGYGLDAARASPSSDYLTIGGYNGGWDWGAGPRPDTPASYFEVANDVSQTAIPWADATVDAVANLNHGRRHPLQLGTYEAGPGYAMNGLNGTQMTPQQDVEQDRVMKSLAAGTATLDAFLARAYRGFTLQNYFAFGRGGKWGSHARWFDGGQAWPAWQLLALFNREGTGAMLRTETLAAPTWRIPDTYRKKATLDIPLVGAYALRRGDRFMLFLTSRKIPDYPVRGSSGFTPVEVDLPFSRYRSATLFRTTGMFSDNNLHEDAIRITSEALGQVIEGHTLKLGARSGTDSRGLAPAATLLYVFEGTDIDHATH
jgi:hypothetical protein